ncbi:hypothetical protein N1851_030343 [Merluccius polli]|uniref:Uncharacterized protein n=1 Tax=Merluccius polli TaxID=89951 RepID=A0AA47M5M1_MERPO|nr:hypothetical protein N1851_030343 [Merluccius polli]
MPPFSTDDYHKLLQKMAVLETKILRLEVNVEVNGQYGNETTLPMTQISGKEQANRQMLCAKPKHNSWKDKSLPSDMGRRLTGRTQHLETCDDTEWPALPSHRRVSSTPVPRIKQPWNVAKTKSKSKPTKDTGILLENRFAQLLQDPDSPKERSSSSTGERYEAKSYTKRLQKELTTGPQALIVGDGAVNKTKHFFSKNTKVLCFTNDMVSNISEKILEITAEHPTFDLRLNTEVFISGPLPTVRRGDERFSRLLMLNRWLKDTCAAQSVNFIDNFNIFGERRHLFEADGFCLNKSGVQLLSYNIFDFLPQSPAAPAKDKRRDNPKQQIRIDHKGQHTEREALTVRVPLKAISLRHEIRSSLVDGLSVPPQVYGCGRYKPLVWDEFNADITGVQDWLKMSTEGVDFSLPKIWIQLAQMAKNVMQEATEFHDSAVPGRAVQTPGFGLWDTPDTLGIRRLNLKYT